MAKKSTLTKVLVGVGMALASVGVIAAGTAIGNNGLKNQLDKWKEDIADKINPDKEDSTKTSTQAAKQLVVYGDYFRG